MTVGTFSICTKCPTQRNCCSRVHADHGVDAPVAFASEIVVIEQYTGRHAADFATFGDSAYSSRLNATSTGCIFFNKGRCEIYPVRPLDCRLFPLDIIRNEEGKLVWIVYQSVCPNEFDPVPLLTEAKTFLRVTFAELNAYADTRNPLLDAHSHVVLAELSSADLSIITDRKPCQSPQLTR